MNDSTTVAWLSKAIEQATKSAKFCVSGTLPSVALGLELDGVGAIAVPLKRGGAKKLIDAGRVAPYGKGTQTLVDKSVRNTFELDPKQFHLSDEWNAAINTVLQPIAEQLGLPPDQLEAKLYKLLVYERGGFFLPHRDSEKHDRMVASLIVVLPNPFEGGLLEIRHGATEESFQFAEAKAGKLPCYAAFYADCEHEVHRVTGGVRLCLAYNLVLKPTRAKPTKAKTSAPVDLLAESIKTWFAKQPSESLVFALEHHYTQRGLSLDLLKGADRELANLVILAAEETDCLLHLAQVSRHLLQFADDGSFEEGYFRGSRAPKRRAIEIGETYEDELNGSEWAEVDGKKQPWGPIAFDLSAIVSSVPINDWEPTSEEYEGYTGNAGNSLDRWYHRSAIVLWPREHHFEVVASSGANNCMPLFNSMVAKLAKTPKKRLEESRLECIRFARAIITEWPKNSAGYWRQTTRVKTPCDDFPDQLLKLHDRIAIALFLAKLAEVDEVLPIGSFVVAVCREFGWNAFALELKKLIAERPEPYNRGRQDIPFRDIEWVSAICCDTTVDSEKTTLIQELIPLVVQRFCQPFPPKTAYFSGHCRPEPTLAEVSLPTLLKALVASGHDADLLRVLRFVQESPAEFRLDECQVPSLKSLIPWSLKQSGSVHPQLANWLNSVRNRLESATAKKPAPPTDWVRPAEVTCKCESCGQLNAFLADPNNKVGRIAAREDLRKHVIEKINRHQCDVTHTLERKKSPFVLVLTKTTGSFERALKRYKTDLQLLSELPLVE